MSTSDRQDQGPLTRKQLREIRLTGSTPVITPEEAAAAAASAAPPASPLPRAAEPADVPPAPTPAPVVAEDEGAAPLTRRQVRERERVSTASVAVPDEQAEDSAVDATAPEQTAAEQTAAVDDEVVAPSASDEPEVVETSVEPALEVPSLVTAVPAFTPPVPADDVDDADDAAADATVAAPVSASSGSADAGEVALVPPTVETSDDEQPSAEADDDPVAAVAALGIEVETPDDDADESDEDDVLADVKDADDAVIEPGERPTVSSAFGQGVLRDTTEPHAPFTPSFDELLTVGDSTGSHHVAPNTLIFTPSPGDGSLSGPVASTGEILVTGSYELPQGLGSQGHAHGTTDGKDVDAVLIDGELPPASSPTPIAASSAISTIKPAGEVIRPPAPEKGNKLMLILAIVAGGLALAVGVAVVIAFTTNVF